MGSEPDGVGGLDSYRAYRGGVHHLTFKRKTPMTSMPQHVTSLSSLFSHFCLIASMVLLNGCAATSIQKDFALKENGAEGIIVVSVSHDRAGGRGSKAIFYLNEGITGANGTMMHSVNETFPGIPGKGEFKDSFGHLLVLSLPAGTHQITGWQLTNGNGLRIFPREKPIPLRFELAAGEVKYLGNLHANMQRGKNIFGIPILADGYPEVRDRRDRDIPLFIERYPQFANRISENLLPLGPWLRNSENIRAIDPPPLVPAIKPR